MNDSIATLMLAIAWTFLLAGSVLESQTDSRFGEGVTVPARFEHGLVDVVPETSEGGQLRFCTDSGGGVLAVRERTARRTLGLDAGTERPVAASFIVARPDR